MGIGSLAEARQCRRAKYRSYCSCGALAWLLRFAGVSLSPGAVQDIGTASCTLADKKHSKASIDFKLALVSIS